MKEIMKEIVIRTILLITFATAVNLLPSENLLGGISAGLFIAILRSDQWPNQTH